MKLTLAKLDFLLTQMKSRSISALLLYGPDKGVIEHIVGAVVRALGVSVSSMMYKEVQDKGIDIVLNNRTLFGGGDVIQIKDISPTIDASLKKLLSSPTHHIPIFIGDELSTSSGIRKFFESEQNLASIGCYPDEPAAVARLVQQKVIESGKKIASDAVQYIVRNVSGDRGLILSEIDKILLYNKDKSYLTLLDIEEVVSNSIAPSPDHLCIAFVSKRLEQYLAELHKLLAENISAVWIIRALIRYYINLYIAHTFMHRGLLIDEAISKIRPPIFFKYLESFKSSLINIQKEDILNALTILNNAECDSKSSNRSMQDICEFIFFQVHNQ